MADKVTRHRIIGSLDPKISNIFDVENEYVIPLYQRSYAWEDKEIRQLIEDISDVSTGTDYYLGTLVVSEQNNTYEVIDGQQRLTTLFLLLNCLGYDVGNKLKFACREKSNYTLKNIKEILKGDRIKFDHDRIEQGIIRGINVIRDEINKSDFNIDIFKEKLASVTIYLIRVPKNTDLNRYFEIMNTRGDQLEQHDILKADLMSDLSVSDGQVFAKIWDACSDMSGYVQMHFRGHDINIRKKIFGNRWDHIPSKDWNDYSGIIDSKTSKTERKQNKLIVDISKPDFVVEPDNGYIEDDSKVRFESIIDFPYFLLHTLKVFVKINNIRHEDTDKQLVPEIMDDKKLTSTFSNVIKYGITDSGRLNKEFFAKGFIACLIRTRFLFDCYIIKREFTKKNIDGTWSLRSLETSGSKNNAYFKPTEFIYFGEHNQELKKHVRSKDNIMIQSALRVSYTSAKTMHWITELLVWLSDDKNRNSLPKLKDIAENVAKKAVVESFLNGKTLKDFSVGSDAQHIVFNYLDYLLWRYDRDSKENKYVDFEFDFRNSVEHWYPRNPSEGTFDKWEEDDGVSRFGNLALLQRNINSRFSNASPDGKKNTYIKIIAKGSIKLRKMSDLTVMKDSRVGSYVWRYENCEKHEREMIDILAKACGVTLSL